LIPKNDEMVTQIIPVRFANAAQMTKDLQPLLPSEGAAMTANESGNALVITDTQAHIHRMAEIVKALDTSISSISSIRVFPLKFADAKELATAVKDLFAPPPTPQNQNGGGRAQQFFNRFGGGGGPGGPGGGNAQSSNAGAPNGNRVVAIADERTNSLVVSAPEDMMPTILKLVNEIDVNANDVTELRVFHLVNADPVEMVDVFTQLFPDETKSNDPNQQNLGFRFNRGGFGGFGRGGRGAAASTESDRLKKKGRVTAVADQRTSSIIVSAASELMPQIAEMVEQLDSSPAKKQKVFVYNLENADVQQVQQILQDMFDRNNLSANRNGANQNSALVNRSLNAVTTGNSAASSTGFGNAGGNGGVAR
jgi:type II secretory pathway component GspD/PulD (secretin)